MTNTTIAAHDAVPTGKDISQSTQPSLISKTYRDPVGHQRADHLVRRLRVVWSDLGLDGTVPKDWVEATSDGLSFGNLTHRQADRLVRVLEDLVLDHGPEVPEPGPGQLSLFGDGLQ